MNDLLKHYWTTVLRFAVKHRTTLLVLLAFSIIAVIFYYPLSFHILTRSPEDVPKDSAFNMWIISWGGHALTHAPWKFFEANMFYPYPHTLAWGDHLFSVTLLALPILPILGVLGTYNFLLIASLALSGFTMFLLIRYLTKSNGAGFLAGALWSISIARLSNWHIQILAMFWLPLIFLYAEKLREKYSRKLFWLLTFFIFMQLATGIYIALYTVMSFALYFLVLLICKKMHKKTAWALMKAWLIAGVLNFPIYLPSIVLNFMHPTVRSLDDNRHSSLAWHQLNPLSVPGRLWRLLVVEAGGKITYQPALFSIGLLLTILVATLLIFKLYKLATNSSKISEDTNTPAAIAFLLLGTYGIIASFGPYITLWTGKTIKNLFFLVPYTLVPGYKVMRIPLRWQFIGIFGLAAFVGILVAKPLTNLKRSWQVLLIGLAVAWLFIEAAPFDQGTYIAPNYDKFPVYRWLAQQPGEFAISELPVYPGKYYLPNDYAEGLRTYFAATHLKQRTGGAFSPFIPNRYIDQAGTINSLGDDPKSIKLLKDIKIKYVILLPDDYKTIWNVNLGPDKKAQFDKLPYLKKVFESNNGIAYEIIY